MAPVHKRCNTDKFYDIDNISRALTLEKWYSPDVTKLVRHEQKGHRVRVMHYSGDV